MGNRISQAIGTSSPFVTQYLLDTQPGLAKVIAATTGGNTGRYVHAPRGIHAMEDNSGNWTWTVQDAQGSVRGEVDNTLAVLGIQHPDPYGNLFGQQGNIGLPFAYTGEMRDPIGLQYHRARYYNPAMGGWLSLDPFEGVAQRPMSLNGYLWVEGNVMSLVDSSGNIPTIADVSSGRARYSCNCGWIDRAHVKGGFTKSKFIHEAINAPIRWNEYTPSVEYGRFIYLNRSGGLNFGFEGLQVDAEYTAYIPEPEARANPEKIALGIYKAFENHFETMQSQANAFDGALGRRASGFSIEDLPSDLIGYYLGMKDTSSSNHLPDGAVFETIQSQTSCDMMNEGESLHMIDEYERAGELEVRFNRWSEWYKKDRPTNVTLPPNRSCSSETWPDEFNMPSIGESSDFLYIRGIQFIGLHPVPVQLRLPETGWWRLRYNLPTYAISVLQREKDRLYLLPRAC